MKLKLSEMASLAEIIGAVAIVVSLVYVGVQVNDSTRAVRSASANETAAAMSAWYAQLGTNEQASGIFINGMTNPESLSREEMFQFVVQLHGLMLGYQAAYYLSQEGTLDVELQESLTNTILGVRDLPGFAVYWGQRKDLFKASFRQYMENLFITGTTNTDMQRLYQPRE
ncbi:MAG TPA: hypothetical protein VIV14_00795 [Gammaproteobacteria bacterium]